MSRILGFAFGNGTPAPAAFSPAMIPESFDFWEGESLLPLGDGAAVAGNWLGLQRGTIASPFGAASQGIVRATGFNSPWATSSAAIEQNTPTTGCSIITDAAFCANFAGLNKGWVVWTLGRILNSATNNYCSFGVSTDVQMYQTFRYLAGVTVKNQYSTRFGGAAGTIDSANEFQALAPQIILWQRAPSGLLRFNKDNIPEAEFTRNSGVTYGCNQFLLGGSSLGGSTIAQATQRINAWGVFTATPNSYWLNRFYREYCAPRLGMQWKKGLTGGLWTGTSKVHIRKGQSNEQGEGRGALPYEPLTAPRAYAFFWNSTLQPAVDAVGSNTNNAYTTYTHLGTGSAVPGFCNAYYAAGKYGPNDAVVEISGAVGGTTAAAWANLAGNIPPSTSSLCGILQCRIVELFRNLPNPVIAADWIYNGENDAISGTAATWGANWTTTQNAMTAFYLARGYVWETGSERVGVIILPVQTALPGASYPDWVAVRIAQQAWQTGRAGSFAVQAPSGPYNAADDLHLDTPGQTILGGLEAAAA